MVQPVALTVGSLFSGIGGFDLGFELAGMEVAWQAEADPAARAVLRHHWPDATMYDDVKDITDATEPVGHPGRSALPSARQRRGCSGG